MGIFFRLHTVIYWHYRCFLSIIFRINNDICFHRWSAHFRDRNVLRALPFGMLLICSWCQRLEIAIVNEVVRLKIAHWPRQQSADFFERFEKTFVKKKWLFIGITRKSLDCEHEHDFIPFSTPMFISVVGVNRTADNGHWTLSFLAIPNRIQLSKSIYGRLFNAVPW